MRKRGGDGGLTMVTPRQTQCSAIKDETCPQIGTTEMSVFQAEEIRPCRVHLGAAGIHYIDHNGEYWDEVLHKKLDDA